MDKNKLEKVIGGGDGDLLSGDTSTARQTQGKTFGESVTR